MSALNSTTMNESAVSLLSPQEDSLRSLCKQILKSRLFRGYYEERRYVETVSSYRDIVALHRSERELQKILLDIRNNLLRSYQHKPNMWVGITNGVLPGMKVHKTALDTFIWAELEEMAFGQYWFNIKSIRFREREIIVKLKMIRNVEAEDIQCSSLMKFGQTPKRKQRTASDKSLTNALMESPPPSAMVSAISCVEGGGGVGGAAPLTTERKMGFNDETVNHNRPAEPQVDFADFIELMNEWGRTIKHTVYEFMSNDVSKDNILAVLRFLGLLVVSILSSGMVAIKFLGVFALRFMFEFSRFTHVISPILLKIIELCNKMIGGFYLLLAMVWKDVMGHRQATTKTQTVDPAAVEYKRPLYKSIEYKVRQEKLHTPHKKEQKNFERKFQ